ncbi:hypothetical protein EGI22_21345 [Lacihabitans sp. LS3-19]|uniref:sensor histidine kinase n=1 Tax=Lacihabitans sp. LS3-19 TaxID=2487335 RepID=UPI0020CE6BF5|nr:histidine kinase [Lacihabitans sp. LS3-19]MCP9770461.1 hypothetical protein [Lacihabitans sp. LS3-19]
MTEITGRRSTRSYITHTIVWAVLFLLPFVNFLYEPEKWATVNKGFLFMQCFGTFYLLVAFYFNFRILAPRYLSKNQNWAFFLVVLSGLLLYILINYFSFTQFFLSEGHILDSKGNSISASERRRWLIFPVVIGPILFYSLNMLISTLLYLFNERSRQREINQLAELEKTATELNMLKLQISPHFLFNTLNNIRWLVRKKSDQSEESILKLSEILRYIIYEVGDSKVSLMQEVEHLRNYIELQKLRIPAGGKVDFIVSEGLESLQIQPLLFIHFVENAFKYGVDGKNATEIVFELKRERNGIVFISKNKILVQGKNSLENEGIGLSNIKRRLELLYPGAYKLDIHKSENQFEVLMKIEINEN